jgi:membrane protein YdbS with pleckstrin-like domain
MNAKKLILAVLIAVLFISMLEALKVCPILSKYRIVLYEIKKNIFSSF